jgi:pyruvate dehydrogenase E2 component (dihydrolipoamide acetyltransferase)
MRARQEIVMPKLGLTMTEGRVAEWKVKPNQAVRRGDIMFVVETEKIANEIEAPQDGVIDEILVGEGDVVPVGAVLGRWTTEAAGTGNGKAPVNANATRTSRIVATPLARRLAGAHSVDLRAVTGSGPHGRVKAGDVMAAKVSAVSAPPGAAAPGRRTAASRFEAAVAERLRIAKRDVPHFYVATEADVGALLSLRDELNSDDRPRISVTHVLLLAIVRAVADFPEANRVWRDGGFEHFATVDVGLAVDTPQGLFVPILRDLAEVPLDAVARRATEVVERARRGELSPDDVSGGVITLSNVGMHDITYLTPIISPGHAAIVGAGSVREVFRPDAEGRPALRRELGLVLAGDHRVLDGVRGAMLLNRIVAYLEKPLRLLRAPGER